MHKIIMKVLACFLLVISVVVSLDNGLALTPPMGWLSWERFRCTTDCKKYPNDCLNEDLIKEMADHLSEDGYRSVGYKYVIIDDCWLAKSRDPNTGELLPDPDRFPSGIPALAEYIHSKGLKFGIYEDIGNKTCGGYPGSAGHWQQDTQTFAKWGVDYVKLDGCYFSVDEMDSAYPSFSKYLNGTGRPMVFSCSWPAYWNFAGKTVNYTKVAEFCNVWRLWSDIQDSWDSVLGIVDYWDKHQKDLIPVAGSGSWNDMDMIIVGDFGLTLGESRAQLALWSVLASPLLLSVDLRTISPQAKDLLLNKDVIAVSQTDMPQGALVKKSLLTSVWARSMPNGDVAVVMLNRGIVLKEKIEFNFSDVGFLHSNASVTDIFAKQHVGCFTKSFEATVVPRDVSFIRLSVV